ncbi:MAG: DUF4412 domain-containing protein [Planctomycetota bacterium]
MGLAANIVILALISAPAFCADTVITKSKHKDAVDLSSFHAPAEDSTVISWLGKDRMRSEEGDHVTIVRTDLKKIYMLDMTAKTASTVELPLDLKQYVPPTLASKMDQMTQRAKIALTPTKETKKVKDWSATKYTMAVTSPMGIEFTHEIWATKDVKFDSAAFHELTGAIMSTVIAGESMAAEYKKIEGLPVVIQRTQTVETGQTITWREEVTSVETKDAPEGWYDVPKGFTEKPFDALEDGPSNPRRGSGTPGERPPVGKPKGK